MKERFESAEIEIVVFDGEDIIKTSGDEDVIDLTESLS